VKQRKAYTREQRRLMIVQSFLVEAEKGNAGQLTCAEIAHYLGVTPSTKLRIILAEMEVDDLLKSKRVKDHGIAGFRRLYSLQDKNPHQSLKNARQAAFGAKRGKRVSGQQVAMWEVLP